MSLISRLFGEGDEDEPIVAVPIPPLITILTALEDQKGAPLTEEEVLAARDGAVCMTMSASRARAMAKSRGYEDMNPENVWAEWIEFRRRQSSLN